jgi:hypothetical protein
MSLYCLKHKVFAYKNHKCSPLSLISITHECRGIANKLYDLGVEPLSVAHFTHPSTDSMYEHYINVCIELRKGYPKNILGDLYTGWHFYTETVSSDHIPLPLLVLSYSETFVWLSYETVEERVLQIIKDFVLYLESRDPEATRALLKLAGFEIGQ